MAADLINDVNGVALQAFPLTFGKINIVTGTIIDCTAVNCVEDGSVMLVYFNETVAMFAGDVYAFENQSVTVISGKFHLA